MAKESGITGHSVDKHYIVFSVYRGQENDAYNHQHMLNYLRRGSIPYKELLGVYSGKPEQSILVNRKYYEELKPIIKAFNQESVLILDNHKHGLYTASFDYLADDRIEFAGYLRSVPKSVAILHEGHSYDPVQRAYFVITDTDATRIDGLKELGLTA